MISAGIANKPLGGDWLLVTDVDNTLLGDDRALVEFVDACDSAPRLAVALNSSRPCADVKKTLQNLPLKVEPAAVIGAMGTQIEIAGGMLDEWTSQFAGWDRKPIDDLLTALGLAAHAPNLQTPFKVSYDVPRSEQSRIEEAIIALGVATRIIKSGTSDFDVLPPAAGKGTATIFLARRLGVTLDRLIVAGDSANDLDMFRASEKGIIVGNADRDLLEAVDADRVYVAACAYAAGLLEGLRHWGVPIKPNRL